jgi:dipeptidyl aminopeptidase/acylaminoacyl peptidase
MSPPPAIIRFDHNSRYQQRSIPYWILNPCDAKEGSMRYPALSVAGILVCLCAGLSLMMGCAETQPEIIPREVIFGNPEKVSPTISPDGTMLAYLAPVDDVLNVWVKTIGQDDDRVVTKDTDRGIRIYFWAADGKHMMYLQDVGGNEDYHLYAVNIETDDIRELTPYEGVRVQVIERDKHFPDELLIGMNMEDPRLFDIYHLDIPTGEIEMVAKNPGNVVGWLADRQMKIRASMTPTADGGFDLYVRETEDSDWVKLLTWDSDNSLTSHPLGFTKDGKYLYCQDSREANASRLVKIDATTGETIEVLAEDPVYDLGGVMINEDTYEPQAVAFAKARMEWVILDESIRGDIEAVKQIDTGDFSIRSVDHADDTWIVGFTKDDGPVPYYVFERETDEATFLFYHRPELTQYTLSPMEAISFNSRDGRTIHGYITYPPAVGRSNLPVVLNVHGGPWARDMWGYHPEAQWLANRGYACLQVNFRGSSGYGKVHLNAGDKEWGGKMHDDLIDGVNWAIDEGIADPERIAIYGGSYGGYAALVGATFTPDVFCCAVDVVGPSNLITFIQTLPAYWQPVLDMWYDRVGNPETEADFLRSRSPLFKADQIKIPMLIAQGANDPRVKQSESEQIVAAMEDNGIEYEYLLFEDEGHGFAKPENRLEFYAAAEKFLAKHLGGRSQDASVE